MRSEEPWLSREGRWADSRGSNETSKAVAKPYAERQHPQGACRRSYKWGWTPRQPDGVQFPMSCHFFCCVHILFTYLNPEIRVIFPSASFVLLRCQSGFVNYQRSSGFLHVNFYNVLPTFKKTGERIPASVVDNDDDWVKKYVFDIWTLGRWQKIHIQKGKRRSHPPDSLNDRFQIICPQLAK